MPPRDGHRSLLTRRMTLMLLAVGLLLALLVAWNLIGRAMMRKAAENMPLAAQTVSSAVVGYAEWQPTLRAVGSLRAHRGAELAFDVSGVVTKIHVASGDLVESGDLLVELRSADDAALLRQAEAAAALSRLTLERMRRQLASKTVSQASYDTALTDDQAKRASVEYARVLLAKKQLRAPFPGRIGIVSLSPGAWVGAGSGVLSLQELNPLYVDFNVPQRRLAELQVGQRIELGSDAWPGRSFEARLTAIAPKIDGDTRNARLEALAPNGEGSLLPGMFVALRIDVGTVERRLTLPQTAITFNPYGETVFLVKPAAAAGEKPTAQQAFVTTGATRGDQIAILGGIEEGDEVVTSGQLKLKNGTPLIIDNTHLPADDPAPRPQER